MAESLFDNRIMELRDSGVLAEEIAKQVGLPETRVIHEISRILNERNEGICFAPDGIPWDKRGLDRVRFQAEN